MINKSVKLYLGNGYPVRIPVSQFDTGWTFTFTIYYNGIEWTIPAGSSVVMNGLKPDGNVFAFSGLVLSNKVVVECDVQMTAVAGDTICELSIIADGKTVGTANFTLAVEAAPKSPNDVSSDSTLPAYAELLEMFSGDIEDEVDSWLNAHSSQIGGLTNEAKQALLTLLAHVAYTDDQGQTYLDALETALYPPADLVSISAVFTQGSAVIYDTDSLDTLKQYLTVTANYNDSTTEVVTTYTLSGVLAAGTSTITVSYGGKTTTFSVTVTEKRVPSGYTEVPYVASLSTGQRSPLVNTGVSPSESGDIHVEIGFMMTTDGTAYKYPIASNSNEGSGSTVGFGINISPNSTNVGAFNGIATTVTPNNEESLLNVKVDAIADFTSTSSAISVGELTNSASGTGRVHPGPIYLFALKNRDYDMLSYMFSGRIYYAKVTDNGEKILDIIPCTRNSDSAAGFYDRVHNSFITASGLTAGGNE